VVDIELEVGKVLVESQQGKLGMEEVVEVAVELDM
jgi:hypothetical protein